MDGRHTGGEQGTSRPESDIPPDAQQHQGHGEGCRVRGCGNCSRTGDADLDLVVLAAITGASGPNIGSMVRARWVNALEDPAVRQTAFAFESVADEIVFVIGPPLVTVLATAISPPVGFLTAISFGLFGGMAFATLTSTEPRGEAFDVCRQLVEEVKARLPIWKRQVFVDGDEEWVAAP